MKVEIKQMKEGEENKAERKLMLTEIKEREMGCRGLIRTTEVACMKTFSYEMTPRCEVHYIRKLQQRDPTPTPHPPLFFTY